MSAMSVFVSDSNYLVEKEALRYDLKAAVADVGGYLGLLLGVSLLNAYDFMVRALNTKKMF